MDGIDRKQLAWFVFGMFFMALLVFAQHVYYKMQPEEGIVRLKPPKPQEAE
jgi:hypothetical protein